MRTLPRVLAAVAVLVAGGVTVIAFGNAPRYSADGASYAVEEGGWRYAYHGVYGRESLVRVSAPGIDLAPQEEERVLRMRRLVLERAGAQDLGDLRGRHEDTAEQLRFLGYL